VVAGAHPDESYEPLAEAVARHLRNAIFEGRLPHGVAIRQEALARELGVSRIPVREALRQLESEGLVTIRPHSGARVTILDLAECIEVYKIRERLEPLAFAESIVNITAEQLDAARRLVDRLDHLTSDAEAWLQADRHFHLATYAGTRMPRLLKTVVDYWNTTQHYRRVLLSTFTPGDFSIFQCDHRLMLDALETRSLRAGEEIVRIHVERSRLRLAEQHALFDR
jgi:DNA-binding GntR family transcriptional regulator